MTQMHPALVLLHGFTGCGDVWNDVKSRLENSRRCIAPDLPGHGASEPPFSANEFTFDRMCDFMEDTLRQSGVKRADFWGYSMGGRIALHLALRNPERVHRLILESASPGISDIEERTGRRRSDDELAGKMETDGLAIFIDHWLSQPLFDSQRSLAPERQSLGKQLRLRSSAKGLADALRGLSVGRQEPLHDRLKGLAMPVLVVAGELDSKYRGIGEEMARSIPDSQFRIIPGAGHAPHWEKPEETAAVVAEFLGKRDDGFPLSRE